MTRLVTDINSLKKIAEKINVKETLGREEAQQIISDLTKFLKDHPGIKAIAAPQLGIQKRVFCINFNGTIKAFVDPIITKKSNIKAVIETFENCPNKEYLVMRPTEIRAIYFNEEVKYEDNIFKDTAATIFDQQAQILDGVIPADIGLESDVAADGPLAGLSQEEFNEAVDMLKQITKIRLEKAETEIGSNDDAADVYKTLKFGEQVIDGSVTVMEDAPNLNREQRRNLAKKNKKAKAKKAIAKNNHKKKRR